MERRPITPNVTFRQISIADGEPQPVEGEDSSALEQWYLDIRDTPIQNFSDGDLARAVRQQMYPSFVVPEALARLERHVDAGDLYAGELLVSLTSVPRDFWLENRALAGRVRLILQMPTNTTEDEHLAEERRRLAERLPPG